MSNKTTPEPQDAQAYTNRGAAYFKKEEWDKAIVDYGKAIELDPQDAHAYFNRGAAYLKKEEWDSAFADFNKAIELDPQNTDAYFGRGFAYDNKGERANAIANYDKAIEINPQNANAYAARGFAYLEKGELDTAIADFGKAIALNPKYAQGYFNRGTAHGKKGEWDNAIADFNEAIKLDPQNTNAYFNRGFAYLTKEDWDNAIANYDKALQLNPQNADAYIHRRRAYLKKGERDQPQESPGLNQALSDLFKIAQNIRRKQFYGSGKPAVAHYASLDTLKNLVNKGRFRLYNSAYMNDQEEGGVFFETMNKIVNARTNREAAQKYDLEEKFYKTGGDIPYRSPAYIGSFIPVDPEKQTGELTSWRLYGKQDGEEAAGSCLIFSREQFGKDHRSQAGSISMTKMNKDLEGREDEKLPIYEIVYTDTEKIQEFGDTEIGKNLSKDLHKLAQCLEKIGDLVEEQGDGDAKNKSKKQVREALDSIRFLFKASHYREEHEVRVLQLHYPQEKSDEIKVDSEQTLPRFYLEAPESFRFSEVILGSQVRHCENWKWWIREQSPNTTVKESSIKYGS